MTMPRERRQAVIRTEKFLIDLMDPKTTARVPKEIRKKAAQCLRHYPTDFDMDNAAVQAPAVFGDKL